MVVAAPKNERELRNLMFTALKSDRPFAIRYPRGGGVGEKWRNEPFEELPIGRGSCLREGDKVAVLTIGTVARFAEQAVERHRENGIRVGHYDLRYAKPLDEELLHTIGGHYQYLLTVEDGTLRGGVGEAVSAWLTSHGYNLKIKSLGIPDAFIEHGTPAELYHLAGYDGEGIYRAIGSLLLER